MTTKDALIPVNRCTLDLIRGVHVEYCGLVPAGHVDQVQEFVEGFVYDGGITVEAWRIAEELEIEPGISRQEAVCRAVVELGHLRFLESLDWDCNYNVAVAPITGGVTI